MSSITCDSTKFQLPCVFRPRDLLAYIAVIAFHITQQNYSKLTPRRPLTNVSGARSWDVSYEDSSPWFVRIIWWLFNMLEEKEKNFKVLFSLKFLLSFCIITSVQPAPVARMKNHTLIWDLKLLYMRWRQHVLLYKFVIFQYKKKKKKQKACDYATRGLTAVLKSFPGGLGTDNKVHPQKTNKQTSKTKYMQLSQQDGFDIWIEIFSTRFYFPIFY